MKHTILFERPGVTIARTYEPETLVPYSPANRPDGTVNHGWQDLRGRPELVELIPEAQKSSGLQDFLRAVCAPDSKIMSIGCECGAFEQPQNSNFGKKWQVGGFADLAFLDTEKNRDQEAFYNLALYLTAGYRPRSQHYVIFEATVEPLKHFFGQGDCLTLDMKPIGFGDTEAEAWAAHDYAWEELARVLLDGRAR